MESRFFKPFISPCGNKTTRRIVQFDIPQRVKTLIPSHVSNVQIR